MEKYILAIDQSTTGTKAVLFDSKLNLFRRVTEYHNQYYPKDGWVEHDPKEILTKTLQACRKLLTDVDARNILAVSITNQRETAMLWNKDGDPLYNAIVWQCQRGRQICQRLRDLGYGKIVREKTGLIIDPYFSASKITWLLENVQGLKSKIQKKRAFFGTIDTWLIWNLCENHPHVTDFSNASRTLLLNIHSLKWDEEMLEIFGINPQIMPSLRFSDEIFGYTDLNGILPRKVPVIGVMGDSSAALYGQMGHNHGDAKATYGTGTSIMINVGKDKPLLESGVLSIGWANSNQVTYVAEGNIHSSGDTLKWLVDQLGLLSSVEEIEELVNCVEDNGGVYFVPAFSGLGAPYWDNDARALVCGMNKRTNKAHFVRAAVESIAYQVHDLFSTLVEETRIKPSHLRVDGGATKSRFLMQFQADILNLPVLVNNIEECSARGVALVAAAKIGVIGPRQVSTDYTEYLPRMAPQTREKYLKEWQTAVKRAILHQ
ncbi:MAG: FGGY-family carbohydrate kinase [Pseudothermotoga sp.]